MNPIRPGKAAALPPTDGVDQEGQRPEAVRPTSAPVHGLHDALPSMERARPVDAQSHTHSPAASSRLATLPQEQLLAIASEVGASGREVMRKVSKPLKWAAENAMHALTVTGPEGLAAIKNPENGYTALRKLTPERTFHG
jgi:hypothetical protein